MKEESKFSKEAVENLSNLYAGDGITIGHGITIGRAKLDFPKSAGYWIINGNYQAIWTKPNWFHKKMTKLLLGWEFEDIKQ